LMQSSDSMQVSDLTQQGVPARPGAAVDTGGGTDDRAVQRP
jgi:hypothetical protein